MITPRTTTRQEDDSQRIAAAAGRVREAGVEGEPAIAVILGRGAGYGLRQTYGRRLRSKATVKRRAGPGALLGAFSGVMHAVCRHPQFVIPRGQSRLRTERQRD